MRFQVLALFLVSAIVSASTLAPASTENAIKSLTKVPTDDIVMFISGFFTNSLDPTYGYDAIILVELIHGLVQYVPLIVSAYEAENVTALFKYGTEAWDKYEHTLIYVNIVRSDLAHFAQTDLLLLEDVPSLARAIIHLTNNETDFSYVKRVLSQAMSNEDFEKLGMIAGYVYDWILEDIKTNPSNDTEGSSLGNITRHDVEYSIWGFLQTANIAINESDYIWFIRNEHAIEAHVPAAFIYAYETKNITAFIEYSTEVYHRYQALVVNFHDLRNQVADFIETELPLFEDEANVTRAALDLFHNQTARSGFEKSLNYAIERHDAVDFGNVVGNVYNWIKNDILSN